MNQPSTNCLSYIAEARAAMKSLEIELKALERRAKAGKCDYSDSGSAFALQEAIVECNVNHRGVWSRIVD